MVVKQPVLLFDFDELREVLAKIHVLQMVGQTHHDAAGSEMACCKMVIVEWDQLTAQGPISYVRLDTNTSVAF